MKNINFITIIIVFIFLSILPISSSLKGGEGISTAYAVNYTASVTVSASSAPSITSISPSAGENTASVSVTSIIGTGFDSSTTVKLVKTGEDDISCASFTFSSSTQLSNGSCPITNAATGAWDVVAKNPDRQTGTLSGGFTISAPSSPTPPPSSGGGSGGGSISPGIGNIIEIIKKPITLIKKLLGLGGLVEIPESFLRGDFNGDGRTGVRDLSILLYYMEYGEPEKKPLYDLNSDGALDIFDISTIFYYWT